MYRRLEPRSLDLSGRRREERQVKVNPVPLHQHMTAPTEANYVVHAVRVVGVVESPHRLDVMHLQHLAPIVAATSSAGTPIAKARRPSDSSPVWAVILRVSASPRGVVLPLSECVAARERAEREPGLTFAAPRAVVVGPLAVCARQRAKDAGPASPRRIPNRRLSRLGVGVWLRHHPLRCPRCASGVVAGLRAEDGVLHPFHLRCCSLDRLRAARTPVLCVGGVRRRYSRVPTRLGASLTAGRGRL